MISKLGIASRTQAARWIAEGRIAVDGRTQREAERPTDATRERITLDGRLLAAQGLAYLALNKPRGYVTTTADERGRERVGERRWRLVFPYPHFESMVDVLELIPVADPGGRR